MTGDSTNARCRTAVATLVACALACVFFASGPARAATLSEKAKESGCVNKPIAVTATLYKCMTASGDPSYFNVPGAPEAEPAPAPRTAPRVASTPSPAGFPKVDAGTQKGRDDVRRKVLSEELATEEKLLTEARTAYADGAPSALPEEKSDVEKYRERIARLRQAMGMHEKNVEALRKELASIK